MSRNHQPGGPVLVEPCRHPNPPDLRYGDVLIVAGSSDATAERFGLRKEADFDDKVTAVLFQIFFEINTLIQQGKLTWEEVGSFLEKTLNKLKENTEANPELAKSRFRRGLEKIGNRIAEMTGQLLVKTSERLRNLMRSRMFRGVITSLIVATLLFGQVQPVVANNPSNPHANNYTALEQVVGEDWVKGSNSFFSRSGVVSTPDQVPLNSNGETSDTGKDCTSEAECKFNLKTIFEALRPYPDILDHTLIQIINDVDEFEKQQDRPNLTGFEILKKDGKKIVSVSDKKYFSELVLVYKDGGLEMRLATNPGSAKAINSKDGIMILRSPYIFSFEDENGNSSRVYLSGVTGLYSHCCGGVPSFRLFNELDELKPDDIIRVTSNGETYEFRVRAAVIIDAQDPMRIFSSDYVTIEEFFNWVAEVQGPSSTKSETLINEFLNGQVLVLSSCLEGAEYLYRDSRTNQLSSKKRVIVFAAYQGTGKPAFVKLPIVFQPISQPTNQEDTSKILSRIEQLLERLYRGYPEIVERRLTEALNLVKSLPVAQTPSPTATSITAPTPVSTPRPNVIPTPIPITEAQAGSQVQDGSGSSQEQQAESISDRIRRLNVELEKAGLTEILPKITLIGETGLVNLQALTSQIIDPNKKGFFELLSYFLFNSDQLELLKGYTRVLAELASLVPEGQPDSEQNLSYAQILRNFVSELESIQWIVENKLLLSGVSLVLLVFLITAAVRLRVLK